jgi:hypothetical protein
MHGINYWAIVVAAVAVFVASTVWYIVFAKQRMKLSDAKSAAMDNMTRPQPLKMLAEIVRNLVLAFVLAYIIVHLGVADWVGAVQFGLLVWIGFPVMLLTGSIMWENVPWKLAAIHAGDWLVKLLLIAVILGVWR